MEQGPNEETPAQDQHAESENRARGQPILGLDRREPRVRIDLTINVPTMISIFVLIVSTSAACVGTYYNMDKRQMATEFVVQNLTSRVEKAEANIAAVKTDQSVQVAQLRAEVKGDLSEIKGLLNQLMLGGSQQRQLREWRK